MLSGIPSAIIFFFSCVAQLSDCYREFLRWGSRLCGPTWAHHPSHLPQRPHGVHVYLIPAQLCLIVPWISSKCSLLLLSYSLNPCEEKYWSCVCVCCVITNLKLVICWTFSSFRVFSFWGLFSICVSLFYFFLIIWSSEELVVCF